MGFGSSPIEIMAQEAMLRGEVFCDFFVYSASWQDGTATDLAASGTTDVQTQINADSDFVVQMLNFVAWTALDTELDDPDYLLTIIIAGSGRQLMNQAQPILNLAGSYSNDHVPSSMSFPKLIPANTTVTSTLTNRTTTANNRADLSFIGFKVFYTQGPNGRTGTRSNVFNLIPGLL